ncbi:MAG TPA: TraR/DksA C4-type zinc finger protein [Acidimicrobiales bacterium]|jgi:RNA polymerase-binding transcription factor DksA|nr:TraR/DksA C4-type zinc finger protein [Acidimicrobiales bacterium]
METELAEDGEGQGSEGGPGEASDGTAPDAHHLQSPEDTIDAVDRLLDGVDGALSRLDDGTYGVCESCGGPIDDARLAESPTTESCSDCVTASQA